MFVILFFYFQAAELHAQDMDGKVCLCIFSLLLFLKLVYIIDYKRINRKLFRFGLLLTDRFSIFEAKIHSRAYPVSAKSPKKQSIRVYF